jgi:hypothetical protein
LIAIEKLLDVLDVVEVARCSGTIELRAPLASAWTQFAIVPGHTTPNCVSRPSKVYRRIIEFKGIENALKYRK